jgi:hypothetical protein
MAFNVSDLVIGLGVMIAVLGVVVGGLGLVLGAVRIPVRASERELALAK